MHFVKDLAEALPVKKEPNVGFLAKKESSHNITAIKRNGYCLPLFFVRINVFQGSV